MYFTSGAKVSTRRSRRAGSPERWYCFQRVSVCSELRRFVDVAMLGVTPEGEREGNAALIGGLPRSLDSHRTDVEFMEHRGKNRSSGVRCCRPHVRDPSPPLRSATMALRLSAAAPELAATPAPDTVALPTQPGAAGTKLRLEARAALTARDVQAYSALFPHADDIEDIHRRHQARLALLE